MKQDRKNALKQVEAPLREKVLTKLVDKLEEKGQGQRTLEVWNMANAARADWLKRQETFQRYVDEFLEPINPKAADWSSNLHLPVVYTAVKTLHARFMAALFDLDTPFSIRARQSANKDREQIVTDTMRYTLKSWINYRQGIEPTADVWLYDIITSGSGVLKARWDKRFTRFTDVVEKQVLRDVFTVVNPDTGESEQLPQYETVEEEQDVTLTVFDGPVADAVAPEDIVVLGGDGDPQLADEVIQQLWLSEGELWTLADQKIFRKESVEKIVRGGKDYKGSEQANGVKLLRTETAGIGSLDNEYDLPRWHILERYCKVDLDGSGIPADVVMWVHKDSGEILRATYLHRISKSGKRPMFRSFFHRRRGDNNGVGLPELMYSLAQEIDAIHNMKIDFGLLSSMPFGYYRPTSSMSEERLPLEPGTLIPLDNPQADVYFPQLGSKWAFAAGEEQFLFTQIERLTSISDLNLGVMSGSQGATRTATGARALLGESNANLNIYLRRINVAWGPFLNFVLEMLQSRMPEGMEFRLFGDDGQLYFRQIKSRDEIAGQYDFELEGSSANSNKAVTIEQANSVFMTILNPLLIQLGVVTPSEIYNALKAKLVAEGVRDFSKFIRKPQGPMRIYTPEEAVNAILAGVDIPMGPEQDLQGFLQFWTYIKDNDELLGQFNQDQVIKVELKAREVQAMLEAVQQQQAQMANQNQVQMNASMGTPTPAGAGAAQAQAPQQAPPEQV